MAKASNDKSIVVELSEVSQTINLDGIAGVKISRDPALRNQISQAIVDYMVGRVQLENLGYDRKPWKAKTYSKSYANSQAFAAAGKSESSIDLTLSGDMMGSIDVTRQSRGEIVIAVTDKQTLSRAYAHMTGYEGHPTIPNGKYIREFFGVSDKEIRTQILPAFKDELRDLEDE